MNPNKKSMSSVDSQKADFQSDNPAFDGASREVWFVYNDYLYQISAYAEFDEFLKELFGTWQFTGN